jgi:hypothetical protein
MSRFSELSKNKLTILMKLIEDERIVKCLVNNEQNFLDVSLPSDFNVTSLIYNSIYPYKFIPAIETEPKTYITMSFRYKPDGITFKNGSIYFYIFTHNSLITTDYGMLRYDFLVNKIDEIFNSSRDIGIGKLPFYEMGDIPINENYSGVYLAYQSTEWQ